MVWGGNRFKNKVYMSAMGNEIKSNMGKYNANSYKDNTLCIVSIC